MKNVIRAALLGIAIALVSLVENSTAFAASYLDEAVQALQSSNVYISLQVGGIDSATQQQLADQAKDSSVAIVVLPPDAANETGGDTQQFVAEIAQRTGYHTVVVAFGDNLEAGSRDLPAGVAEQLANQAEAGHGPVGGELLGLIPEIRSAVGQNAPDTSGSDVGSALVIVLLVLAASTAGAVAAGKKLRRRRPASEPRLPQPTIHDELSASLATMRQYGDSIKDTTLSNDVLTIVAKTQEIIGRICRDLPDRLDDKTRELIDTVDEVNVVLKMHLKAQGSPHYFNDEKEVERVKADTRKVIDAYGKNVSHNLSIVSNNLGIIDPNTMVAFKVAVDKLTKPAFNQNPERE